MQPLQLIQRLWEMVVHARAVLLSPNTPLMVKIGLVAGLLYILSPYDLIPEWVPVLGMMDDLALACLLLAWAGRYQARR